MWQMLAAQTLMNFASAGSKYKAAKQQYKAEKAFQDYRNTMTRLSDAQSQNAITTNETMSNAAFARQAIQLDKATIGTTGKVAVSAAAAGVRGRSVNQVLIQVQRNSAQQERERQIALESSWLSFDQQRKNSAMSAAMSIDYSYIPKPKASSFYMDAAMNSMQTGMQMYGGGSSAGNNIAFDFWNVDGGASG